MRYGAVIRGATIDEITEDVLSNRAAGYHSCWLTDGIGMEPLTVLAVVGREVDGIELGTSVVRTLPRHPLVMAQQALTVSALVGGRLALGIGPSHKPAVERGWGLPFERPVTHMRDYLSVLMPVIRGGSVDYDGATASGHAEFRVEGAVSCPVLVGALGPQMLSLAGRLADGTVTFQVGPRTLAGFTCPTILEAAERAGRPRPRIVAMLPMCVTGDVPAARERAARLSGAVAALPSYAAMIEREQGPALIAGDEDVVGETVAGLETAGVTDIVAVRMAKRESDDHLRTEAYLSRLVQGT